MSHAVVLAAGRGSRLVEPRPGVILTPAQEVAARAGSKALMPVPDRPLIDYVLGALEAVGIQRIGVVVGSRHEALVRHLETLPLELTLLRQATPRGTADALLAAADFAAAAPSLVINADTYYPPEALAELQALPGPGLLALDRARVLRDGRSNLTDAKLSRFALVEVGDRGELRGLLEKPDSATWNERLAGTAPVLVSVNAFRLGPEFFEVCRRVPWSPRGELELPAAVTLAVSEGMVFAVAVTAAPLLDLTDRGDVGAVAARLVGRPAVGPR